MTTNQEGRQAAIRDSTSTAYGVAADWHALFDDAGISAGTFNERLLAWINDQLGTSYSNILGAMAAYAADAGFNAWSSISTLVLGGASTLLSGETDGLAFDFTDSSARIKDTSTPANEYSSTGIVSSGSLVGPSGKLTYTSPSNKLTRQADGFLKYQAHNLWGYSEDYGSNAVGANSNATNASGNTISISASDAYFYRRTDWSPLVAGATYVVNLDVTCSASAVVGLRFTDGADAGITYQEVTCVAGVTQSVSVTFTLSGTAGNLRIGVDQRASEVPNADDLTGETVTLNYVHVYRYPANTDYIKTTTAAKYALPLEYDTSGNCLGLLVEEARTELLLYNTNIEDSANWSSTSATTTEVAQQAPWSGDISVCKIVPNGTAIGAHRGAYRSGTILALGAGNSCILSAYVKADGYTQVGLRESTTTGAGCVFNLSAGTAYTPYSNGTLTASSPTIEAVGNDWYRIAVVLTDSGAGTNVGFAVYVYDGGYTSGDLEGYIYSGNTTDGVLCTLPSLQDQKTFPTSPILTYGAAATRNADNISIATSAFPYNQPEGTVYSSFIADYTGGNSRVFSLDNGVGARVLDSYYNNATTLTTYNGTTNIPSVSYTDGATTKLAAAYKTTDYAHCSNGGTVQTLASATVNTATKINVGQAGNATAQFCGIIKAISYVPRRKSNAELQAETA